MRRVKIRETKGPSHGIKSANLRSEIHGLPNFEKRTHDETLKQERRARRDAWELATDVCKLTTESTDTVYSPAEAWVMLAPSSTKPEERHFLIDSGASMHMSSKKGLEFRRAGDSQEI